MNVSSCFDGSWMAGDGKSFKARNSYFSISYSTNYLKSRWHVTFSSNTSMVSKDNSKQSSWYGECCVWYCTSVIPLWVVASFLVYLLHEICNFVGNIRRLATACNKTSHVQNIVHIMMRQVRKHILVPFNWKCKLSIGNYSGYMKSEVCEVIGHI